MIFLAKQSQILNQYDLLESQNKLIPHDDGWKIQVSINVLHDLWSRMLAILLCEIYLDIKLYLGGRRGRRIQMVEYSEFVFHFRSAQLLGGFLMGRQMRSLEFRHVDQTFVLLTRVPPRLFCRLE